MIVGNGTKSGIRIATTNPMEIGADRVVDAVGATFCMAVGCLSLITAWLRHMIW